ncbi:MAG TPA: hypothetical protein IGS37_04125 [Synechococcales cyanobacterium M55_K2018_004]|nr:hypothetical protein [Synechococcales cyanobacterium M55_K2018_004]
MQIRSVLACGAALAVLSAPVVVGTAVLLPTSTAIAQQALNVAGEGEGALSIGSRPRQTVVFASVASSANGQAEIALRLADGNLQRWNGRLVSNRGGEARINLTNAGMADATGTVTVRFQGNRLISLVGNGTIDSQPMSLRFTIGDDSVSRPPTPPTSTTTNLASSGTGVFGLQGRPNRNINFASVTVQPNGNAELSIRLSDGNLVRFGGQQTRKDATDIVLNLTSSGNADARGTANIRYGMNNSIVSINSNGTLDNQPFFIQFTGQQTSQPVPPPTTNATVFCTGQMGNGWRYRAEAVNRRFTQIRWERSGAQPTVTTLRFYRNNAQGEPIYRGAFRAATEVTLIDLGKGNPRPGTQVSVGVEEWGWSRGNCR